MRKQIWTRLSAAVMASLLTATPPSGAIALEYVTSLPFVESAATQPLVQTLMATGVPYLDETGTPQTAANATEIQSNTTTWSNGWYVVHGDVTINGQVTVSGDVHLILADYANLTVNGGIFVKKDNHLHLYAQSTGADMGTLTAESQKKATQESVADSRKVQAALPSTETISLQLMETMQRIWKMRQKHPPEKP